ncbi:hypothetical protein [Paenibacillus sp. FSL R5-0519]|uniref:hypothetical protein n=1 Tax=Paenibacillus sp. FSL R5-0519 TaxID=2921648 RepID=UPI0030DC03F9
MEYQQNKDDPDQELLEEELEEVVGGLATVSIARCKVCHIRIAVYEMSVCAACFRKTQVPLAGEGANHD